MVEPLTLLAICAPETSPLADSIPLKSTSGIKLLDGSQEIKTKYNLSNMTDATAGALTVVADGQMGQEAQVGILTFDLKDLVFSSTSADTAGDVTFQVAGADFMNSAWAYIRPLPAAIGS